MEQPPPTRPLVGRPLRLPPPPSPLPPPPRGYRTPPGLADSPAAPRLPPRAGRKRGREQPSHPAHPLPKNKQK